MKDTTSRLLTPVLIFLLGATVVRWWLQGDLANYLHPDTIWLTAGGGAVLVVLSVGAIATHRRLQPTPSQLLVLLVVVGLVTFVRPAPLSSSLAQKRQSDEALPVASRRTVNLNKLTEYFTILDWRRAWEVDPTHRRYIGKTVKVTGFVLVEGERRFVGRLLITCCAVDTRPVRLELDAAQPLPAAGTWVTVEGVMAIAGSDPVVRVERVTVVEQPASPYLY